MEKRLVNLPGYENLYYIYENGDCYSIRNNRFLRPQINSCGYVMYFLTPNPINGQRQKGKHQMAHRLVLMAFKCFPKEGQEANHKDHNRMNNHYSNLEWCTHSENILKSFKDNGRNSYWLGKHKAPFSLETRLKMSNAKLKPVMCYDIRNNTTTKYNSIEECINDIKIGRRTFNRYFTDYIKNPKYKFTFITD